MVDFKLGSLKIKYNQPAFELDFFFPEFSFSFLSFWDLSCFLYLLPFRQAEKGVCSMRCQKLLFCTSGFLISEEKD